MPNDSEFSENDSDNYEDSHVSSHHKLNDPEEIDYDVNTYLTIFDNIFKRTTEEMTTREKIRKALIKEMGKASSYAYQKLTILENRANDKYYSKE